MKKKVLVPIVVLLALATPLVLLTSKAEDSILEKTYLSNLRSYNHEIIQTKTDKELLSLAYKTCQSLSDGLNADQALLDVFELENVKSDTTFIYAAIIVSDSVAVFCPQFQDQIDDWVY